MKTAEQKLREQAQKEELNSLLDRALNGENVSLDPDQTDNVIIDPPYIPVEGEEFFVND